MNCSSNPARCTGFFSTAASSIAPAIIVACVVSFCVPRNAYSETGKRPNVLLIVADDMGFSDIGSFGSEIATP